MVWVCLYVLFEVAFDEAVQVSRQVLAVAPQSEYPVALSAEPVGTMKSVPTLLHSLVQSCRFWLTMPSGVPYGHQEAVLPPVSVFGTDHATIGKTLLLGLQNRVFGQDIRQWIAQLGSRGVQLMMFIVSSDYASSNLVVLDVIRALVMAAHDGAAGCLMTLIWWHFERCGCHQVMRASVSVAAVTGEKDAQRSKSKLLRMRRSKEAFQSATLAEYAKAFDFNGVKKSEAQLQQRAKCIDVVMSLLKIKHQAEHFHEGASSVERAAAAEQLAAVQDFLDFHNNSSPLDDHFSRLESRAQVTREQALQEGKRLLALFRVHVPQWNKARMLRYVGCQRWWCRFSVLMPVQAKIWHSFRPAKARVTGDSGQERNVTAEDGVRLERARRYSDNPRARALSVLSYSCLGHVEALVALFFYMASDNIEGDPIVQASGSVAPPQLPYSLTPEDMDDAGAAEPPDDVEHGAAEEPLPGRPRARKPMPSGPGRRTVNKKGMCFIVDANEQFVCELWSAVSTSGYFVTTHQVQDHPVTPTALRYVREVTVLFWPDVAGEEEACHMMVDKVILTLLAEMIFRFLLAHREEPYSSCGVRGAQPSDGQIQDVLGVQIWTWVAKCWIWLSKSRIWLSKSRSWLSKFRAWISRSRF